MQRDIILYESRSDIAATQLGITLLSTQFVECRW